MEVIRLISCYIYRSVVLQARERNKMKKVILTAAIIFASFVSYAKPLTGEVHVNVKGMVCAFCAQGLTKTFKQQPEVENVTVSLEKKFVHLVLKKGQAMDSDKIVNLIKEAGYEGIIQGN